MREFDRMEWPRRYKMKSTVILMVLIAISVGLRVHKCQQDLIANTIVISDLSFVEWGSQYIELAYSVENTDLRPHTVMLLAKVWDQNDQELASALFEVELPANSVQKRSKLLDRLQRSLKQGESPGRANITIYQRKAF